MYNIDKREGNKEVQTMTKYTVVIEINGKRRTLRGVDTWRLIGMLEKTLDRGGRVISAIQETITPPA